MSHDVWEREVKRLIDSQQRQLTLIAAAATRLSRQIDTMRAELSRRSEELSVRHADPVVLYSNRSAGPKPTYHSAARPCGQGGRISHPIRALLGDAVAKGIRRCEF